MANKKSMVSGNGLIPLLVPKPRTNMFGLLTKTRKSTTMALETWSMANKRSTATGNGLIPLRVLKLRTNL